MCDRRLSKVVSATLIELVYQWLESTRPISPT